MRTRFASPSHRPVHGIRHQFFTANCMYVHALATAQRKNARIIVDYADIPEFHSISWRRGRDSNPWQPVAQLGSLANYWFQPLTHLSGLRLSSERTERKSRSKFVNDQISGLKINENNALEQHITASPQEIRTGKHNKEQLLPDIPYANSPVNRSKNTPSTNTETVAAPPPGNIGGIARGAAQPDHTPGQGKRT